MRILITGAGGFIGSHLAESLMENGYSVIGFDSQFERSQNAINLERIVGDLTQVDMLDDMIARSDIIVHLAAVSRVEDGQREPERCFKVNVGGTTRILESLKKYSGKTLIFGSSREVYGEPEKFPVTELHPRNPISVYGISKLTSEMLISLYGKLLGINYVILRFSNVYGSPRDLTERVIPKFANLAAEGLSLTINGGNQILDFTFVDDVVQGITNLVHKISDGDESCISQQYHLTSGKGISVLSLAEIIKNVFRSNSAIEIRKTRNFDVQKFVGDYTKARLAFSYEPRHSLTDGLKKYRSRIETMKSQTKTFVNM
ncbi:MAG: NAD-dependent epimerase/dehydratase family protein [Nitrososphaerales archaeon]